MARRTSSALVSLTDGLRGRLDARLQLALDRLVALGALGVGEVALLLALDVRHSCPVHPLWIGATRLPPAVFDPTGLIGVFRGDLSARDTPSARNTPMGGQVRARRDRRATRISMTSVAVEITAAAEVEVGGGEQVDRPADRRSTEPAGLLHRLACRVAGLDAQAPPRHQPRCAARGRRASPACRSGPAGSPSPAAGGARRHRASARAARAPCAVRPPSMASVRSHGGTPPASPRNGSTCSGPSTRLRRTSPTTSAAPHRAHRRSRRDGRRPARRPAPLRRTSDRLGLGLDPATAVARPVRGRRRRDRRPRLRQRLVEGLGAALTPPLDHQLGRRQRIGEVADEHGRARRREAARRPSHDDAAFGEERCGVGGVDDGPKRVVLGVELVDHQRPVTVADERVDQVLTAARRIDSSSPVST